MFSLIVLAAGVALTVEPSFAQVPPVAAAARTPAAPLPEPIYWRQSLFLIPYQWSAAGDSNPAESVWLYVSKDRGANWQKISEARPQVRAFNYHAEADGEYWFAIRTTDRAGRSWPAGPIEPELRVIVDTTIPRVERLAGIVGDDGTLEIDWQIADANLDARSWQIEVQTDLRSDWQAVTPPPATLIAPGVAAGRVTAQLAGGGGAVAVRVAATDLAGNRAVSQANVTPRSISQSAANGPAIISGRRDEDRHGGYDPAVDDEQSVDAYGWVASTPSSAGSRSNPIESSTDVPPVDQPWPAGNRESLLTYPRGDENESRPGVDVVSSEFASFAGPTAERRSPFAPLEPFRERAGAAWQSVDDATISGIGAASSTAAGELDPWLWLSGPDVAVPPGVTPKLVNSRTFVLEYELEDIGPWGVSKVELWGTRDGGRTWRSYATDDDHMSPMKVTVSEAGLYGFRIVVSGGGGVGGFPPLPGERPELWIGVDLHRPEIELTGAEPGRGDVAGHMTLRWWADDDNLDGRPIGLFYSSRPVGPWTAIATNLSNTGEYPWRLERHLPPRVYLRLEARDTAGNLAAYQTYEPVSIELPPPAGRIQSVESLDGPTAWSGAVSPR